MEMITDFGKLKRGKLQWLDDFTHDEDEKGVVTASHSFACFADEVLKLCPKKGAACVQPGWGVLRRTTVSSRLEGGGKAYVTCTYKAFVGADGEFTFEPEDDDSKRVCELSVTENIEQAEGAFPDVPENERIIIQAVKDGVLKPVEGEDYVFQDPETLGTSEISTDDGKILVKLIQKGEHTRTVPCQYWRVSYASRNPPGSTILNQVGKIATAKGAPSVSDDRNWLFVGCNVTETGGIYNTSLEWKLSPPGGFSPSLYS